MVLRVRLTEWHCAAVVILELGGCPVHLCGTYSEAECCRSDNAACYLAEAAGFPVPVRLREMSEPCRCDKGPLAWYPLSGCNADLVLGTRSTRVAPARPDERDKIIDGIQRSSSALAVKPVPQKTSPCAVAQQDTIGRKRQNRYRDEDAHKYILSPWLRLYMYM